MLFLSSYMFIFYLVYVHFRTLLMKNISYPVFYGSANQNNSSDGSGFDDQTRKLNYFYFL
jgi:hypothetical protein